MAAGAWVFTATARTKMLDGQFAIATDTYKMALFLSTSNLTTASTTYAGVTNEHAGNNGYTTGGIAVDLTLAGTTTGRSISTTTSRLFRGRVEMGSVPTIKARDRPRHIAGSNRG